MKIGLVSFHQHPNYGTMLQAYALAYVLKKEGVTCAYLDYRFVRRPLWYRLAAAIARKVGLLQPEAFAFFKTKAFQTIQHKFDAFHREFIPMSEQVYYTDNIHTAQTHFDYFMVGSDQTWSPALTQNPHTINFLSFVEDHDKKRAYAPSIGTLHISEAFSKKLTEQLASFKYLSCRERQNCEYLKKLLQRDVTYVVDPTLLVTSEEWNQLAIAPAMPAKSYILAYILGEKPCIASFAESLGKKYNLPVYYVATRPCYLQQPRVLDEAGPCEFLGLIRDAAYVVTDSFHGTLFSINFGTEFYSFTKHNDTKAGIQNDNDRILAFLQEIGLENRFKNDSDKTFEERIDYATTRLKLQALRKESWTFITKIIK